MYDLFNDHTSADDAVAVADATARELHTKAKFIDARTILRVPYALRSPWGSVWSRLFSRAHNKLLNVCAHKSRVAVSRREASSAVCFSNACICVAGARHSRRRPWASLNCIHIDKSSCPPSLVWSIGHVTARRSEWIRCLCYAYNVPCGHTITHLPCCSVASLYANRCDLLIPHIMLILLCFARLNNAHYYFELKRLYFVFT